jgi:hypothetical protein
LLHQGHHGVLYQRWQQVGDKRGGRAPALVDKDGYSTQRLGPYAHEVITFIDDSCSAALGSVLFHPTLATSTTFPIKISM